MRTAIIYKSKHGCTRYAAEMVKNRISSGEVDIIDIGKRNISLDDYNVVIIGGSIHAGGIQKKVQDFCSNHIEILKKKKLGLFICCMKEGQEAKEQFLNAFPPELREHSLANGIFGGEFNFNKMNFIEKFLVKKIAKVDNSVSKLNMDAIAKFVDVLFVS